MTPEEFYALRDRRTVQYGGCVEKLRRPISIVVGPDAATSVPGQIAALALLNMVARAHRRVTLVVPDTPLRALGLFGKATLADELLAVARAVDPYGEFTQVSSIRPDGLGLGLGRGIPGLPWYVGVSGVTAKVTAEPTSFEDESDPARLAAGLSACMGAAHLFRVAHGLPVGPTTVCAWHLQDGECEGAPATIGRLDVGDVDIIGGGAVGGAFGYWVREFSPLGRWTWVDGDVARLHNTNRGLLLFPSDTEWALASPRPKVLCLAERTGMFHFNGWYHEWIAKNPLRPDLILPLANERGVRAAIGQRGEPVLLHTSTSSTWEAQLHRHVPGQDDCIVCRLSGTEATVARFGCSEAPVPDPANSGESADAALPFLSAAAGHLLLVGLLRMQHQQLGGCENFWRLNFQSIARRFGRAHVSCADDCRTGLPTSVRRALNEGRRWAG